MGNGTVESSSLALKGMNLSGQQTASLKYDVPPKDLLVFVPGTTDPVNSTPTQHAANGKYWQKDMLTAVGKLKREYKDLHVMTENFSWSGDNSKAEREKAGNRLRELLYARVKGPKNGDALYKGWKDKAVSVHLIGHSHGGNVINEFTKAIKQHGDFPKLWKIKSITYLSTPFFSKMHQLDTSHFHPQARIVNVFNKYDLTQRVVADYTMRQLPWMIDHVQGDPEFAQMMAGIQSLTKDTFDKLALLARWSGYLNDETEGKPLWQSMVVILNSIIHGTTATKTIINKLNKGFPDVISSKSKGIVEKLAGDVESWAVRARNNFNTRLAADSHWYSSKYSRGAFIEDLALGHLFQALNAFLAFHPTTFSGNLFDLLDDIIMGQLDRFDDTKTTPKDQAKGVPIFDVPVNQHDKYNGLRDAQWATFISKVEATQRKYHASPSSTLRMEFLLYLFAQMPYAPLKDATDNLNKAEWLLTGFDDKQCKALKATLLSLFAQLETRNCKIVVPADMGEGTSFMDKVLHARGSIGYTATTSHSVSHRDLYDEVKKVLAPAFDSGKNPGYLLEIRN